MPVLEPRPRWLVPQIRQALDDTRIVVIQGARQVGKSTLAAAMAAERDGRLVSLDDDTQRAAAELDPIGFITQLPGRLLVIDEVQRVPALVTALKLAVDSDPRPGRFLLTGSSDLLRLPAVHDSLAGRAESLELFGFSQGELAGHPEQFLDRVLGGDLFAGHRSPLSRQDYLLRACAGGYPEALARPAGRRRSSWFDNYLTRIVERDAHDISGLQRLQALPRLLRLLAARNSAELVLSEIAVTINIPVRTLPPYLDLLETLFLIQLLPAWSTNLSKRVVRRPKASLLDTGLAARLINISAAGAGPASNPDAAGGLLEGFVTGELRRQLGWSREYPRLHHYRDHDGPEIDIIAETDDGRVVGIEVKAAATVTGKDTKWLATLRDKLRSRFTAGLILYTGPVSVPFGDRISAVPLDILWTA